MAILLSKAGSKLYNPLILTLMVSLCLLAACSSMKPPEYCKGLCLEAETSTLSGLFIVERGQEASGGEFVRSLETNEADLSDHMQAPNPNDWFRLEFEVEPGRYTIKTWVAAKDFASDSFYVQLNDEPYFIYSFNNTSVRDVYPGFVTDKLREASDDPKVFDLKAKNSLTFFMRESGAALDRLELIPVLD